MRLALTLTKHATWTDELNEVVVATQMCNDAEGGRLVEVAYNVSLVQDELRGKRSTPKLRTVRAYLHRLRTEGYDSNQYPDARLLEINYVKKSGRRYAVGPSMQYLPNKVACEVLRGHHD